MLAMAAMLAAANKTFLTTIKPCPSGRG